MTVHNFVQTINVGQTVKIPSNCTFTDLASYGASRFGYTFRKVGNDRMMRVCPCCHR